MAILPPNPDKIGVARHLSARVLPVLKWPNPKLNLKCNDITTDEFNSDELGQLLMDMCLTMDTNNGIGLAASQLGILKNIIVTGTHVSTTEVNHSNSPTTPSEYINPVIQHKILINPEIINYGKTDAIFNAEEGCISVPGYFERRERPYFVTIKYQDTKGTYHTELFERLDAFVVQHEIDHLNGKIFVDELSKLKKDRIKKKIKRYTPTPENIYNTPL